MGGERGLIGAVKMAVSENHDLALPSQSRDHNRLMPASYMLLGNHGMQQGASSILTGR